ncbi:hypothetical protein FHU38_000961 [Saccharomonospora amisosensis]|uniref:Uncharacterized protein n=1 Tax=Saccharomonospora amisosensis TaxID=1128677 RepID=A0A7X5ZPD5_9PSEU|nr:hypothetical protein [Saccharomonospora amisosensis]NIJ10617.1 hypothetical protein [Saccharomonospora amisosensis]
MNPDPKALDLLDQALQNPAHVHIGHIDVDNIRVTQPSEDAGTGKDYSLRKLRKDAPEQVKAG